MTEEILENILDILDVVMTAGIVIWMIPMFRRTRQPLTVAFYYFAMVSLMLTNAYWLAHSLIRPDMRMPMATNTIGECAVFLLLSAAMNSVFPDRKFSFTPQHAGAILFVIASIALWIVWSGEWIQDILGGVIFGYFICVCVRDLRETGAFSKKEWIAIGVTCAGFMAIFAAVATMEEEPPAVIAGYILMFAMMLFFLYKTIRCIRKRESAEKQMVLAVSSYACCMSGVYMSSGYWYSAAELICLTTLPMMFHAFREEAKHA